MKAKASNLKIRAATPSDLQKIDTINQAVQPHPWSPKSLLEEIDQTAGQNVVLTTQDESMVVGYFFMRNYKKTAEIMTLGLASSYQGQGLGAYLVTEALKACPPGCEVFLEVSHLNTRALNLYKKLGFEVISTRKAYYNDGSHALCMRLHIAKD